MPQGSQMALGACIYLTLRKLEELSPFLAEGRKFLTCTFFTTPISILR